MATSAFSEARVRTAQAQARAEKPVGAPLNSSASRVLNHVIARPRPSDLSDGNRLSARGAARFGGSQGLCGRNRLSLLQAAGLRTRWFVFGASGSRRTIATKIASRLVLEGADFDRHDTGDLLPEPGHPHDREASCLRLVLRDYAGSQEPWIRSPPES